MITMTRELVISMISNPEELISFQKSILNDEVEKWDLDEFIYYLKRLSHGRNIVRISGQYDMATEWTSTTDIVWWGSDDPEAIPIPEAYFDCLIPTRLICACLLSIVYKDEAKLADERLLSVLPSALDLCAVYGLKHMASSDLEMTIDAFKASKAWLFVDSNPDFCKAFTNFIKTNQATLGYVEE